MNIDYSPEFKRLFKKLSKSVKLGAVQKEKVFRKNLRDTCLKTHKLTGKLRGKFAFSISYSHRIIFSIKSNKTVMFHSIGDHDIYK